MSFDAGSIKAKMVLDKTQFSSGLQSSVKEAKAADAAMGAIFAGGLLVAGLTIATKKLFDLGRAGAELKRLEQSFNRVADAAGTSPRSIIAQGRSDSGGAFSDRQIMVFTNRLVAAGVEVNNLSHLMRIANATAAATGRTQSDVMEKMIKDIGNAKYANAKLNDTLREGDKLIEQFGTHSDDFGTKLDSLGAMFKNIGDNIKKDLLPFLNAVISGVSWLLKTAASSSWYGINMPPKDNEMLGPGMTPGQLMGQKVRDRKAEEARKWLEDLMAKRRRPANQVRPMGTGNTFVGLDWREVTDPGLTMGADQWTQTFDLIGSGLSTLGDSFSSFFEMLVTDSANAGRAFFSGLMGGLSNLTSAFGDFFIRTGIGMLAIQTIQPLAAIAAGVALKALAGIMRGIAFNNAPISAGPARSLRNPLGNGEGAGGAFTLVVNGDFVGDRVWVQRLASMIRQNERNFGSPKVVFNS